MCCTTGSVPHGLPAMVLPARRGCRSCLLGQGKSCADRKGIKVWGGGGVGEAPLLQKGPSPTKRLKRIQLRRGPPPQSTSSPTCSKKLPPHSSKKQKRAQEHAFAKNYEPLSEGGGDQSGAISSKEVYGDIYISSATPTGPLRCLPIMISATPCGGRSAGLTNLYTSSR